MTDIQTAIVLKPFVMLFMGIFILYPCKRLVQLRMKESKFKRLLLRNIGP